MTEGLKRFAAEDGYLRGPDECDYEPGDLIGLVQVGILGFCACGDPEANLEFVRDGLSHIDDLRKCWRDSEKPMTYEAWDEQEARLFGSKRAARFFYYWADLQELTEHGGSVPGWLTPKGEQLVADINEALGA